MEKTKEHGEKQKDTGIKTKGQLDSNPIVLREENDDVKARMKG